MSTFQGIPAGAFEFYAELEDNNNREWWLEHKDSYNTLVRDPVTALLAELEPRFGPGKVFRPNRDIRFSQDKSPYKTAQGGFAATQEGVGYYVQVSADGLLVGGGWENDGELTLSAHTLHTEDSDFGQAGTLYREVYDDAAKARFLDTITGAVGGVKRSDIKERAIQYWTNVDAELGAKLRANLGAAPLSEAEAANKIG